MICNTKAKVPSILCGIYRISCKTCPSKYIGETEQDYRTRIKEHEQAISNNNTKISPVASHMHENNHELDPTSFKLLLREPRKYFRKFKESIHIRSLHNRMNISKGQPVSSIWSSTLINFLKYER